MSTSPFNTALYRLRRERLKPQQIKHHALINLAYQRHRETLEEMQRVFPVVFQPSCGVSDLGDFLMARQGTQCVIKSDLAQSLLHYTSGIRVAASPEPLPFKEGSFDLIVSTLELHAVNDVPGVLRQWLKLLKPGGVLLANCWGGETLKELRHALLAAEMEHGVVPRVSPMIDVKMLAQLAAYAGFSIPVSDCEAITVLYQNVCDVMKDLKAQGESSILHARHKGLVTPQWLQRVEAHYPRTQSKVAVTFELISLFAVRD